MRCRLAAQYFRWPPATQAVLGAIDPRAAKGLNPAITSTFQVTLNYRRHDTSGHAGRLYDALAERFGSEHVFMDIDKIDPGVDFAEAINRAIGSADAFICLIGTEWLTSTDAKGRYRLENPGDLVRLEIEAALRREIRVIPVLVQGAEMPQSGELPESLAGLARRNAIEIRDSSWHHDVGRLIQTLEKIDLEKADAGATEAADGEPSMAEARKPRVSAPERASVKQALPPRPPSGEPQASPLGLLARVWRVLRAHKLLALGGVAALVVALLVVLQLLSAGGREVRMKSVGKYYDARAQLDSGNLTLLAKRELYRDGRLKLLLFNKWAKVGKRPADPVEVETLKFSEKDANVEAGGAGYIEVTPPEGWRDAYTYFGIAKLEKPTDNGPGELVVYARVDDL